MKTLQDLEKEQDKMSIFRDFEQLKQYIVTIKDLLEAISLLSDKEKLEVIKLDYLQRQSAYTKSSAVMLIKDEGVKSQIIHDLPLIEAVFDKYNFLKFLGTVSEEDKMYVLSNSDILKKFAIPKYEIKNIINTMSKENGAKILSDKELMAQFDFYEFEIRDLIISEIDDDDLKLEFAKKKGVDHECHKNEELEKSVTINMDLQSLREVYKSIGVADKEGKFPIGQLIEQARKIDETSTDMQTNIRSKFALLRKWCPEFATCQNSTIDVLRDVLFENNEHFSFRRCIASRVYNREDENKNAVLYVYMELEDGRNQFFYADKESGEFIQMSQEEFGRKFECYETDRQKLPGNKRPWETNVEIEQKKQNSSGEVVAEEGR